MRQNRYTVRALCPWATRTIPLTHAILRDFPNSLFANTSERNGVRANAGQGVSVLPVPARVPRNLDRWAILAGGCWRRKPGLARSEVVRVLDRTLVGRWHIRHRDGGGHGDLG